MTIQMTFVRLFLAIVLMIGQDASAIVALCRWAFDQGPRPETTSSLMIDLEKPLPSNYKAARAISAPLKTANAVLGRYLILPQILRLEFYKGLGQAICSTHRIWVNHSVLQLSKWTPRELAVFFHEYGHIVFGINMSKFFEGKSPKHWNPEAFFGRQLETEKEMDALVSAMEKYIETLSNQSSLSEGDKTKLQVELQAYIAERARLKKSLDGFANFDFDAYEKSMMYKTKDIQEVFADMVSAIAMRDPQAISRHFPDTFDGIFRNFEMSEAQLARLEKDPVFTKEQATDPHIKSLLRYVINRELYLDHGKRIGQDEEHDARAIHIAFEYMTPTMIGMLVDGKRWPPGTGPLAVALALKYKTAISSEDVFYGNLAAWLREEPRLRQVLSSNSLRAILARAEEINVERERASPSRERTNMSDTQTRSGSATNRK